MSWEIEELLNQSSNARVEILFYDSQNPYGIMNPVVGYLTNETIPLGTSADWESLFENGLSAQALGGLVNNIFGAVGAGIDIALRANGISPVPAVSTLSYWKNSKKPEFTVDLLFINYETGNESCNPLRPVISLNSRCLPQLWEPTLLAQAGNGLGGVMGGILSGINSLLRLGSNALGVFQSPMGYTPAENVAAKLTNFPQGGGGQAGTCDLQIGNWLRATNLLLTDSKFEVSTVCDPRGVPLFANGSITLQSNRLITYQEYQSWFLKGK